MTEPETTSSSSRREYTIIRIKRKRSEDVPDVLVVDGKGTKRRKSGVNVFHYAETIDEDAWKRMKQDELRKRISALSKSPPKVDDVGAGEATPASPNAMKRRRNTQTNGSARQYRVIPQEPRHASRFYPMPPKVLSSNDPQKCTSKIRIYDAELAPAETAQDDAEMEKFQTLLQDYLKGSLMTIHDDVPGNLSLRAGDGSSISATIQPSTLGDYVYDIFYHRPSALVNQAGAINMATITGLPFDEDDEDDSDSEIEDEADEDSNAEDYYKNDYPDEESSESNSEGSDLWSEDEWDDSGRFKPD